MRLLGAERWVTSAHLPNDDSLANRPVCMTRRSPRGIAAASGGSFKAPIRQSSVCPRSRACRISKTPYHGAPPTPGCRMALTLTSSDLAQREPAMTVPLSPLLYGDVESWRPAVRTNVQTLVRGDKSGFMLPIEREPLIQMDPADDLPQRVREYRPTHRRPASSSATRPSTSSRSVGVNSNSCGRDHI